MPDYHVQSFFGESNPKPKRAPRKRKGQTPATGAPQAIPEGVLEDTLSIPETAAIPESALWQEQTQREVVMASEGIPEGTQEGTQDERLEQERAAEARYYTALSAQEQRAYRRSLFMRYLVTTGKLSEFPGLTHAQGVRMLGNTASLDAFTQAPMTPERSGVFSQDTPKEWFG
jgi:hypothetical protein